MFAQWRGSGRGRTEALHVHVAEGSLVRVQVRHADVLERISPDHIPAVRVAGPALALFQGIVMLSGLARRTARQIEKASLFYSRPWPGSRRCPPARC